jgi:hypothetical protein
LLHFEPLGDGARAQAVLFALAQPAHEISFAVIPTHRPPLAAAPVVVRR